MIKKVEPERVGSPHDVELEGADAKPPAAVPRGGEVDGNDLRPQPVSELISVVRTPGVPRATRAPVRRCPPRAAVASSARP